MLVETHLFRPNRKQTQNESIRLFIYVFTCVFIYLFISVTHNEMFDQIIETEIDGLMCIYLFFNCG